MQCPYCKKEVQENAIKCDCGYQFVDYEGQQSQPKIYETNMQGGFFSFRTMVSRTLIQFIYILGALGLSIYGIILIAKAANSNSVELGATGLGILLLGNLIWRIICEAWILLFNIHDVLVSIERKI